MSRDGVLVGIDVGTSACKAGAVGLDGRELTTARCPTPWKVVATGAQLHPDVLWRTALDAVGQALSGLPPDVPVLGLGVASIAETGVLLDRGGHPVAPAIAWHDRRGDPPDLDARSFTVATGLPLSVACSASKYRWLRSHHAPAAHGRRWLSVAEWIVYRFGGEQVAERSLASRTGWFDRTAGVWWEPALEAADVPRDLLPQVVTAGTPAGKVRAGPPRLRDAVLTAAGHDHGVGVVGAGATRRGDVYDSCGTAEAFVAAVEGDIRPDDVVRLVGQGVTVGAHVLGDRQALMGGPRSGMELQRLLERCGVADPGEIDHADPPLTAQWWATLEDLAQRGTAALRAIEACAGPTRRIVVGGGWARHPSVRQVKRERFGDVYYPAVTEAGVRGAALLAGCAAGIYPRPSDVPPPAAR